MFVHKHIIQFNSIHYKVVIRDEVRCMARAPAVIVTAVCRGRGAFNMFVNVLEVVVSQGQRRDLGICGSMGTRQ